MGKVELTLLNIQRSIRKSFVNVKNTFFVEKIVDFSYNIFCSFYSYKTVTVLNPKSKPYFIRIIYIR